MVTFKKFGRKYTVPEADAPATPTRAQRRSEAGSRAFFARARAAAAAPPVLAPPTPGFAFATAGEGAAPRASPRVR